MQAAHHHHELPPHVAALLPLGWLPPPYQPRAAALLLQRAGTRPGQPAPCRRPTWGSWGASPLGQPGRLVPAPGPPQRASLCFGWGCTCPQFSQRRHRPAAIGHPIRLAKPTLTAAPWGPVGAKHQVHIAHNRLHHRAVGGTQPTALGQGGLAPKPHQLIANISTGPTPTSGGDRR